MIRIAIAGAGAITERAHIPALASVASAQIVAIQTRTADKAERIARTLSPDDANRPKIYSDFDEMLARERPDAVGIFTPNNLHCEFTIKALNAGAHVLVEKPMAPTAAAARKMVDAAVKANRVLMVAMQRRFGGIERAIKDALTSSAIGKPNFIRARLSHGGPHLWAPGQKWFTTASEAGGGAMLDLGVHVADLAIWFMGDVDSVSGQVGILAKQIEVDDTGAMILHFKSGALGVVEASWSSMPPLSSIEIYGSEGRVMAGYPRNDISILKSDGTPAPGFSREDVMGRFDPRDLLAPSRALAENFIAAIQGRAQPSPDGNDGLRAVEAIEACYRSSRTGTRIKLPLASCSTHMFRESIKNMAPYRPGEQPRPGQRLIKLNTNENPYPPSPRVRRAVAKVMAGSALRLYPAPRADEFVASAAKIYSIPENMILAGNGSDELLAMVFRATLGDGDTVAYPVPTYSLYDTLALVQEARIIHIPLGGDFALPLDALADARANLTIVCNPNSPSGTLTPARKLSALAKRLDGRLLVIDEAYVDFADENALGLVRRHRNVAVLRTLSKSYSLAGMRLGLCFAHPSVIDALMKVKDSYNLSRVALAAGAEALRDAAWMRRNVAKVIQTRSRTETRLRQLGFEVPPSQANFVLARMPGRDMAPVARGLRRAGILVRHFATPLLQDAVRISIGTPAEMNALFKALDPLLRANPSKSKRRARA